jgi:TolB protein
MRRRALGTNLVGAIACVTTCCFGVAGPAAQATTVAGPAAQATTVTDAYLTGANLTGAEVGSGVQAQSGAIPWSRVGPGWFVALWGPHDAVFPGPAVQRWEAQRTSLFLVDPLGGRYLVATLPAPSTYQLFDWSGDGKRVLIGTPAAGAGSMSQVEEIDLVDGQVLSHFAAPNPYSASYLFTRPMGEQLLRTSQNAKGVISVARISTPGAVEQSYRATLPAIASVNGSVLPSLDGTELVVAGAHGLALFYNNGSFVKDIGPPEQCSPARWWGTTELVASCLTFGSGSSSEPALWLVPTDGPAAQLTFPKPPDYGDVNGWKVGASIYVQALGACGTEFLAERKLGGATKDIAVPGTANDERVIGADGSQLALQAVLGCGGGQSLFWFDPSNSKEIPLLGSPLNGGGVLAALPYPGLQP